MPRLLIQFARYGPYHHARLRAAHEIMSLLGWEVIGMETAGNDATYAWEESKSVASGPSVVTVFPGRVHEEITSAECKRTLYPLLDSLNPDAIAIAGWASPDALSCLSWCRKHDRRRIVMSETREADGKRVWWKERIKSYFISRFDSALVGGKSHRDYLVKLGMPADKIRFGYNVVDNAYFAAEAARWRDRESGDRNQRSEVRDQERANTPEQSASSLSTINSQPFIPVKPRGDDGSAFSPKYFLASNRFIERKNLSRLIDAYSAYLQQSTINSQPFIPAKPRGDDGSTPWNLCLLGDGELKPALIAQCHRLGLTVIESAPWEVLDSFKIQHSKSNIVYFPGFRQIEELPRFYAHAGCFVHPALEEPWGLVLNEAMACGLPVLSGNNVGAAEELVDDGVNGWRFDAGNAEELAQLMVKISDFGFPISDCCAASVRILEERCPTPAFGSGLSKVLQ